MSDIWMSGLFFTEVLHSKCTFFALPSRMFPHARSSRTSGMGDYHAKWQEIIQHVKHA